MHLSDYLNADCVRHNVEAGSKKSVLETLSEILATAYPSITTQDIFNCLVSREKLGSTGLGNGVALPHGRLASIDQPACVFLQLNKPVDFEASDNKPVDLIIGLIVPEESTDQHLRILSAIAEKFSQPDFTASLRTSETPQQLLALLTA